MSRRIAHRGPDGEATFLNHHRAPTADDPQVGLAFRRLAVLDPDPRAMQPMTTEDGRHTIVFNGEIYNFKYLRDQLNRECGMVDWKTNSDSEVLLHALANWGPAAIEKLEGMFAIAWWDEREKRLLLVRDRMGQKPLYFSLGRWSLAFASEPAALRSWPDWDQEVAADAIVEYLRFGYVNAPNSIEAGIAQVMPGHTLVVDNIHRPLLQQAYFDPNAAPAKSPPGHGGKIVDPGSTFRPLIRSAVERQLVSDVPLGLFLSGGVDSSIICACARRFGRVQTFSIGFDDAAYDESRYAAEVARHLDTDHHSFVFAPPSPDDLVNLAKTFGEPFGDSSILPSVYLAGQTRKHVTVALSGDGGDELFGGYDRYRAMRWPVGTLRPLGPLTGSVGRLLAERSGKSRANRIGRLLQSVAMPTLLRYLSYLQIFSDSQIEMLTGEPPVWRGRVGREWSGLSVGRSHATTAMAFDRVNYLPGDLLAKVDRCSMTHALEVRSPFMDKAVVQAAAGLTDGQVFRRGRRTTAATGRSAPGGTVNSLKSSIAKKQILFEAFGDELPQSVFARPKMGFAVPVGQWFRGHLRPVLTDHLTAEASYCRQHFNRPYVEKLLSDHAKERADHAQRLFSLLMLELWWKDRTL